MAFDRTLDFLLSNFTSHEFAWKVGSFIWDAKLFGLENVTRSCPIIIYETKEVGHPEMRFFARACGEVPELDLIGATQLLPDRVSVVFLPCFVSESILALNCEIDTQENTTNYRIW